MNFLHVGCIFRSDPPPLHRRLSVSTASGSRSADCPAALRSRPAALCCPGRFAERAVCHGHLLLGSDAAGSLASVSVSSRVSILSVRSETFASDQLNARCPCLIEEAQ